MNGVKSWFAPDYKLERIEVARDIVQIYQGYMTSGEVSRLHEQQSVA